MLNILRIRDVPAAIEGRTTRSQELLKIRLDKRATGCIIFLFVKNGNVPIIYLAPAAVPFTGCAAMQRKEKDEQVDYVKDKDRGVHACYDPVSGPIRLDERSGGHSSYLCGWTVWLQLVCRVQR